MKSAIPPMLLLPRFLPLLLCLAASSRVGAHGPGRSNDFGGHRVLFIGIDGCRADAVVAAMDRGLAPQMKALCGDECGLITRQFHAGGEKDTATWQPTISGPGWSSLLTGTWIDRHHVRDNRFLGARFQTWSHFMRRIKEAKTGAWCAPFTDWPPIHDFIADGSRVDGKEFLDVKFTTAPDASRHFVDNPEKDIEVRDHALDSLRAQDPDAMFVYFGQIDEFGHGAVDSRASFSPDSTLYLHAIGLVDSHIGELVRAMRARPQFSAEDWLVLITTDHGGRGTSHGGDSDDERDIWLIAHGASLPRKEMLEQPLSQISLVPLIYRHLGITPRPEWNPEPPPEPPVPPADRAFKVEVDISRAPECEGFALKAKAICEEWYPRINEILFGRDRPLPRAEVRLTFEPMKGVAHTTADGIHISADWVTRKAPNDYGMVVHELTHVVQAYHGGGEGWLTEGIADYVRHQHFEKDGATLKERINPDTASYKQAYTTAAAFLIWLEEKKENQVVRRLNAASENGTYDRRIWQELCGAPLDDLWKEFAGSLRTSRQKGN